MVHRCDTARYRNAAICRRVMSAPGQNRGGIRGAASAGDLPPGDPLGVCLMDGAVLVAEPARAHQSRGLEGAGGGRQRTTASAA